MTYNKMQLKQMALQLIRLRKLNDRRYFKFCLHLRLATGAPIIQIKSRIKEYAAYVPHG